MNEQAEFAVVAPIYRSVKLRLRDYDTDESMPLNRLHALYTELSLLSPWRGYTHRKPTTTQITIATLAHMAYFIQRKGMIAVVIAIGALVIVSQKTVNPRLFTSAAIGDPGNIKVTLTREGDNARVSGGQLSAVCDGSAITFTDNNARDLDAADGVIEITPNIGELLTTGCNTEGETLILTATSSTGIYVTTTVTTSLSLLGVNTISISSIPFPLKVTVKDEFGAAATADTITYNSAAPTVSSGSVYYWTQAAGTAGLAVEKIGYVSSASTNTGLSAISIVATNQTAVTLGAHDARSDAVSSGASVTAKGLQPTVKLVVQQANESKNIDASVTLEKSTGGGTNYSSLTPSNITSNVGYDAAAAGAAVLYRAIAGGQSVISSSTTPSTSSQTTVTLNIPATIRRPQATGETSSSTQPVQLIPPAPAEPVASSPAPVSLVPTPEELPLPLPSPVPTIVLPPPSKPIFPPPQVLSATSIQWNLPTNLPLAFPFTFPSRFTLSKVESERGAQRITEINSKVITVFSKLSNDTFIIEEGLSPDTNYANRVLTIDTFPGYFLFPSVSTYPLNTPPLTLAADSTKENPRMLLPRANRDPATRIAIIDTATQLYLQPDGSFGEQQVWRAWYKWGLARKLDSGAIDSDNRVLYFGDTVLRHTSYFLAEKSQDSSGKESALSPALKIDYGSQK